MSEILIETSRGELVENIVRGDVAVVGKEGQLIAHLGNPQYFTYMRSTAKPLQASAAVESGAIDFFGINEDELAIMCGSHIGDDYHVLVLESILNKIGLDENSLTLGADLSFSNELKFKRIAENVAPRKLYNNCSGKHAAMLTICRYMGWDYSAYQHPDHPVQILIKKTVAAYAQVPVEELVIGVDGCGVPVFAMPLSKMALAYHYLANSHKLPSKRKEAARRITSAMVAYPQMVAGYGHFCTELMRATAGRIIGKLGADGVYCAAVINGDIAISLKIEDGNGIMLAPAMMRILNQLDLLNKSEQAKLAKFEIIDNYNCQNDKVGETRAIFELIKE